MLTDFEIGFRPQMYDEPSLDPETLCVQQMGKFYNSIVGLGHACFSVDQWGELKNMVVQNFFEGNIKEEF